MTISPAVTVESISSLPRASVVSAFVRRDFLVTRSYRMAFMMDAIYGPLELAVYYFISQTLDVPPMEQLQGAPSYFAYAAVGIIIGAVVAAASSDIGYSLREAQLTGTLEALAGQPVKTTELCTGLLCFPLIFAFARAAVYLAIASLWMSLDVSQTSWAGLVLVVLASAGALASLGILTGALVLVFKKGQTFAGAAIFAMTLLSGAVFPIETLPAPLEALARVLPIRFAFDGARAALFTGEGWGTDVLALLGYAVVLTPLSLVAFSTALRRAKRAGSLSSY
jgi:ABC-2 type transport system permease protein